MQQTEAFSTPLEVAPVDGVIAITGPDGVAIALTREAAIASAKRLLEAAGEDDSAETYQKPLG
jgi:hypothetical protein